jgi:multidrug efflux pump subunit AcrA (membrane-fusion protein)
MAMMVKATRAASSREGEGTAVEVSNGVKPGDQVILNPPVNLADGDKVEVRPDTPVPTS